MRRKPQLHATYIRMRALKCNECYARVIGLLSRSVSFPFHVATGVEAESLALGTRTGATSLP
jgi:hypothetical protein